MKRTDKQIENLVKNFEGMHAGTGLAAEFGREILELRAALRSSQTFFLVEKPEKGDQPEWIKKVVAQVSKALEGTASEK